MLPSIKPLSFLISKYIKEMINTLSQEVLLSKKTKLVSARFSSKVTTIALLFIEI